MDMKEVLIRLTLSALLGGLIGLERQVKNHPAGLKTNTLVCIGAAATMVLAELLCARQFSLYGAISDPSRIAGQVVSGIGFLGAGTIMHSDSNIKGLTTAASLWTVASIGLVAGSGYYYIAISITIIVFLVLNVYSLILNKIAKTPSVSKVTIGFEPDVEVANDVLNTLSTYNIDINDVEVNIPMGECFEVDIAEISFTPINYKQLVKILNSLENVKKNVKYTKKELATHSNI